MADCAAIHYAEIALKGKNRKRFEDLLVQNIKEKLKGIESTQRESGQITINLNKKAQETEVKDTLKRIPGIAHFALAKKASLDIEKLKKETKEYAKDLKYETFKIDTRRHDKKYPLKSSEINAQIGECIEGKVKLKNPDLTIKVEIGDKHAYISHETIQGVGGLPTNEKQKVVALLSGGFDSPVAAYMMMKRGCQAVMVHFQNKNQMTGAVKTKVQDLAKQLSKYQKSTKLYTIPFDTIQKEIIMKTKAEIRMLIYRRFMLKIAEKIAEKEGARFLVTGDSLSQVSSQTIENLQATYEGLKMHVFTPLIGMNKEEIIKISRDLGTHDISSQPYGDCCSYFLPKHPKLKATAGLLRSIEENFDTEKLTEEAIEKAEVKEF